jgi:hypothetical protein
VESGVKLTKRILVRRESPEEKRAGTSPGHQDPYDIISAFVSSDEHSFDCSTHTGSKCEKKLKYLKTEYVMRQ